MIDIVGLFFAKLESDDIPENFDDIFISQCRDLMSDIKIQPLIQTQTSDKTEIIAFLGKE